MPKPPLQGDNVDYSDDLDSSQKSKKVEPVNTRKNKKLKKRNLHVKTVVNSTSTPDLASLSNPKEDLGPQIVINEGEPISARFSEYGNYGTLEKLKEESVAQSEPVSAKLSAYGDYGTLDKLEEPLTATLSPDNEDKKEEITRDHPTFDYMDEVFFKKQKIESSVTPEKITKSNFLEKTITLMGLDVLNKRRSEHPQQRQLEHDVLYPTAVNEQWSGKALSTMQAIFHTLYKEHISKLYENHMEYLSANVYKFVSMTSLSKDYDLKKNEIYVEYDKEKKELRYKILTKEGKIINDCLTAQDIDAINKLRPEKKEKGELVHLSFLDTLEQKADDPSALQPFLENILDITSEKGHTYNMKDYIVPFYEWVPRFVAALEPTNEFRQYYDKGSFNIMYLRTEEEREPYKVIFKDGLAYVSTNHPHHPSKEQTSEDGLVLADSQHVNKDETLRRHQLIYVLLKDKKTSEITMYVGQDKNGQFHHSTLSGAESVLAAGTIAFNQGKPIFISHETGHYRVPEKRFQEYLIPFLESKNSIQHVEYIKKFTVNSETKNAEVQLLQKEEAQSYIKDSLIIAHEEKKKNAATVIVNTLKQAVADRKLKQGSDKKTMVSSTGSISQKLNLKLEKPQLTTSIPKEIAISHGATNDSVLPLDVNNKKEVIAKEKQTESRLSFTKR